MIGELQNQWRVQQAIADARKKTCRLGIITGYDPNKYVVKVQIQPEGLMTPWIPLGALWVGSGWGMYTAPSNGDQVLVQFVDEEFSAGIATLLTFTAAMPPASVPSGEFWLVHKSGAFFKLTNDGKLTFTDGKGATVQLDGAGNIVSQATNWTHTGPMHITGNVQMDANLQVNQTINANTDVTSNGISLVNHLTTGVRAGTDISGPPVG